MITITEIAKLANVSRGTVDRVIHNRGHVSKDKERRVKKVIKEINYKPNIFGRGLKLSKRIQFGVIMPDTSNDVFYWDLAVMGIDKALEELSGYNVDVKYYMFDNFTVDSFVSQCHAAFREADELDGLLIVPIMTDVGSRLIDEIPDSLPYVFFNNTIEGKGVLSYIGPNGFNGAYLAGSLLGRVLQGSANIVLLNEYIHEFRERVEGFSSYFDNRPEVNLRVYEADRKTDSQVLAHLTQKAYAENKDIDGFYCTSSSVDEVADFVEQFKPEKKPLIVGYDLTQQNIGHMKRGSIEFLINQRPESQAYLGIQYLYRHVVLRAKIQKRLHTPLDIVVRENVDFYLNV